MPAPEVLKLALADGTSADYPSVGVALGDSDPFAGARRVACVGDDGVAAGTVSGKVEFRIDHFPYAEMLQVHAGSITLETDGQKQVVGVGECVVIGYATALWLEMGANTVAAFCAATAMGTETNPGLTVIHRYGDLPPSATLEPPILIGPAPQCRALSTFQDTASPLKVGVWDSTPYQRHARAHRTHEFMNLIEGQVTLTMESGKVIDVQTGDSVFVPQGAPCAWTSTGYVRKFYAVG